MRSNVTATKKCRTLVNHAKLGLRYINILLHFRVRKCSRNPGYRNYMVVRFISHVVLFFFFFFSLKSTVTFVKWVNFREMQHELVRGKPFNFTIRTTSDEM